MDAHTLVSAFVGVFILGQGVQFKHPGQKKCAKPLLNWFLVSLCWFFRFFFVICIWKTFPHKGRVWPTLTEKPIKGGKGWEGCLGDQASTLGFAAHQGGGAAGLYPAQLWFVEIQVFLTPSSLPKCLFLALFLGIFWDKNLPKDTSKTPF